MLHVTLNTGTTVEIARQDDPASLKALFDALVDARGGPVVTWQPWRTDLLVGEGCAMFTIRKSSEELAVLCAVAWTEAGADRAWHEIEQPYLDAGDVLGRTGHLHPGMDALPEMPETLPWLASWVMPAAASFATLDDARWLADCEQLMAFAILRRHGGTPDYDRSGRFQ